ncbi:preprotein translocase subunit SecG [soil metagenome]
MSILSIVLLVIQLLSAAGIIVLVLLQHGKGADMGAAFGSGASGSLFGATGSANFLSRATGVLATVFFVSTLGLAAVGGGKANTGGGIMSDVPGVTQPAPATAPATGSTPADAQPATAAPAVPATPPSDIPK